MIPIRMTRRVAAFLIDIGLIILLTILLRTANPIEFLLVAAIYHAAFRLRTPGRMLMKVIVLRSDGSDIGTVRAFVRTLLYVFSAIPLGLGFFWALWDRKKRAFHDLAAGTEVVSAPAGSPPSRTRVIITLCLFTVISFICVVTAPTDQTIPFDDLPLATVRSVPLPNGKPAMSAYMLTGNNQGEETWRTTLRRMKAMGVQVVEIGQIRWDEMEPAAGQYKWGYAQTVLRINKEENLGLKFAADIGMFINPGLDGVPKLPAHLAGKAFDDPAVIESLGALYEAFLNLSGAENVTYLFQHFENAAAVVANRPEDVPRLQKLLRESFGRAKRLRPDLRTGVCIQRYEKQHWPASEIERWNLEIGTDVVPIISFGPSEFDPYGDPSRTRAEFESVIAAAGGRPIALNETGYNSAEGTGSSSAAQAAFVRELFALLRDRHAQIEIATWYEYSDLDPLAAKALGVYLAAITGNPLGAGYFADNMGTAGLLTNDGRAKPAARVWVEEAAQYYAFRAGLINKTR